MVGKGVSEEFIKGLIISGTRLDSISSLWGVPIENLEKMKEEIQSQQDKKFLYTFAELRNAYYRLYAPNVLDYTEIFGKNENSSIRKSLDKLETLRKEILEVDKKLSALKFQLQESKGDTVKLSKLKVEFDEAHQNMTVALSKYLGALGKLMKEPMSIGQMEEIVRGIRFSELDNEFVVNNFTVHRSYDDKKKKFVSMYAMKILPYIKEIDDVEVLQRLKEEISVLDSYEMYTETLKSKINEKLRSKNSTSFVRKISSEAELICGRVASGILDRFGDIEEIKVQFEEGLQEKSFNSNNGITITSDRQQMDTMVCKKIAESSKIAENYVEIVKRIVETVGVSYHEAVAAVSKNLIKHGRFANARELIEYFRLREESLEELAYLYNSMEKEVIRAEIGHGIKTVICKPRAAGTDRNRDIQESRFMQTIYNRLKCSDVGVSGISLGKNADGTKDISLKDVWPKSLEQGLLR